jgi:hypothetical protein
MTAKKPVDSLILTIRGHKVILDSDLAALYGSSTKALNQAVKRNAERFPEDFMFVLSEAESVEVASNRSQIVTGSQRHRDPRFRPKAFTEHGAIMAASILNSPEAIVMSVYVVRAFVQMREQMIANAQVLKRLAEIDKTLLEHDEALATIWSKLQPLLAPPPEPKKRQIGFVTEEST